MKYWCSQGRSKLNIENNTLKIAITTKSKNSGEIEKGRKRLLHLDVTVRFLFPLYICFVYTVAWDI